jgi:2-keto-4-pentenoate hydratase
MSKAEDAALLLLQARQTGAKLPDLPADIQPQTLAEAYAIQDACVRLYGDIGGWKISPNAVADDYRCAPIFRSVIHRSPADDVISDPSSCEVEVEIALILAQDLPPRVAPYTVGDVENAIESVACAIEVLSSRYTDFRKVARYSALADMQANGAVIIGQDRSEWRSFDFTSATAKIAVNDQVKINTSGAARGKIMGSFALLANHAAARGFHLKRGDIIMTGAQAGPIPAGAGHNIFGEINRMQCRLSLT